MTAAQAFAHGILRDPKSRDIGRSHALAGLPWQCGDEHNMVDYALGYADGQADRLCCGGECAQPELPQ